MNEPIRCRSLISLVARYPSNQEEMNPHCGVTETKLMVEVEGWVGGININHSPSSLRDTVQPRHTESGNIKTLFLFWIAALNLIT